MKPVVMVVKERAESDSIAKKAKIRCSEGREGSLDREGN
jgi:hypothetical protein